ncbi:response regulator [Novosphingobium sp. MW5]|nr:response regulator [Novosphingobium sp. MW5]
MHEARVLVVDDSAAMRALFSDILEQQRDVRVVGTAASADEARGAIAELKPNVVTLDVEMPGMSGIDFLKEIMETKPMPVVMLSGLTQSGTEVSLKAYELGAVECFPKPLKATPDQFAKTVGKLGKIVLAAANSNLRSKPRVKAAVEAPPFKWNGHIAAFSASMGGIDALSILLSGWPQNCPPTVICLQAEQPLIETFIARLDADCKCSVRALKDGAQLVQGVVHVTADQGSHAVLEAGTPPRLRLLPRDPVDGARPSANLLFGTFARAGIPAAAAVLSGLGEDGAKGLKMMRDAGADTFAQDPSSAMVAEAPAASIAAGGAKSQLALEELGAALLAACSQD